MVEFVRKHSATHCKKMNKTYSSSNLVNCLLFLIIAIILILIAGLRPIGFDRDSFNYLDSFDEFSGLLIANYLDKEPSFWVFSWLTKVLHGDIHFLFLAYAAIAVLLIIASIRRMSMMPYFSLFCYLFLIYPLHGLTQMRVGVASALFLYAIPAIHDRRLGAFALKIGLATLFHYSAIILFLVYFLNGKHPGRIFYSALPLFGFGVAALGGLLLQFVPELISILPSVVSYKLEIYLALLEQGVGEEINFFSYYYLLIAVVYIYCIVNVDCFAGRLDGLMVKILGWSLFSYYALSFIPTFAFRISEMLGVVVIFVFPSVAQTIKEKYAAATVLGFSILLAFVNNVFIHQLFNL